ncbi:MAG TPA: metalloregulator ArsR/SmtB family transcription factor [Rhizobium sp.]
MSRDGYSRNDEITALTEFLSLFSHRMRLHMLIIISREEKSVGELAKYLQTSPSSVSQQLSLLRLHNMVETRRVSQTVYYRCTSPVVRKMLATLQRMSGDLQE